MIVAILVIGYVLILRYLDQKNRDRDRRKQGFEVTGPADYATLKQSLAEISQRLSGLEAEYRELAQRAGGTR